MVERRSPPPGSPVHESAAGGATALAPPVEPRGGADGRPAATGSGELGSGDGAASRGSSNVGPAGGAVCGDIGAEKAPGTGTDAGAGTGAPDAITGAGVEGSGSWSVPDAGAAALGVKVAEASGGAGTPGSDVVRLGAGTVGAARPGS
jgi:hypothetical protein